MIQVTTATSYWYLKKLIIHTSKSKKCC